MASRTLGDRLQLSLESAEEKTRTSTPFRAHEPESCASTNSATSAYICQFRSRIIANSPEIKMPIKLRDLCVSSIAIKKSEVLRRRRFLKDDKSAFLVIRNHLFMVSGCSNLASASSSAFIKACTDIWSLNTKNSPPPINTIKPTAQATMPKLTAATSASPLIS